MSLRSSAARWEEQQDVVIWGHAQRLAAGDMAGVDLSGAVFNGAWIAAANFGDASLRGAQLRAWACYSLWLSYSARSGAGLEPAAARHRPPGTASCRYCVNDLAFALAHQVRSKTIGV